VLKRFCIAAAAAILLSCTATKPNISAPPSGVQPPLQTSPLHLPPAGTYHIDPSRSELRLLVYRAGALANLGHNHVILNRSVNGSISVAPTLGASSLSFSIPVSAFIVDDLQARGEEGGDFPGEVPDEAKSGTMKNMTGPAVLNSAEYPTISVRSTRLEELQGIPTATLAVSIAGHESTVSVPFVLGNEGRDLSANASFELHQTSLGMTPFSLMLGALAVRDAMQVKLKVTAQLESR
jgi:polyisoprenoid-binding protein YceI